MRVGWVGFRKELKGDEVEAIRMGHMTQGLVGLLGRFPCGLTSIQYWYAVDHSVATFP